MTQPAKRCWLLLALVATGLGNESVGIATAADEHLATPKLGKAAVACEKVIAQVGAKVVADKLKALDACAKLIDGRL